MFVTGKCVILSKVVGGGCKVHRAYSPPAGNVRPQSKSGELRIISSCPVVKSLGDSAGIVGKTILTILNCHLDYYSIYYQKVRLGVIIRCGGKPGKYFGRLAGRGERCNCNFHC